ncbi:carbohydrate ABC transporter permease [Alicyclobacillus sendaiensis]|uniref:Sugar ABC transporter permease n=1 Tax=Alicyclobacillus sendaiensis PA2 TaxID=3029425 RepID=A0ABT6Y2S1_ALISE|nr:sugar ABC transporter permease [Alicyclobacillus sendaiensis]MDI9261169.1 sugar ABC transporter permease [Alicyclobacillus sendaiensis PA2]
MSTSEVGMTVNTYAHSGAVKRSHRLTSLFFLAPASLVMLVFFFGPVLWTFYISFTNISLTGPTATHYQFTGIENFRDMFSNTAFWQSVLVSLWYLIGSALIGQNVLGMILAVIMQRAHPVIRASVGAIVIASWVIPEIVKAFTWYAFFSQNGTLDAFMKLFGLKTSLDWLYVHPLLSIIIANTWAGTAFSMMVYTAALSDVPIDLVEAAKIDGASSWTAFVRVVIPLIKNSIMTNTILITLQTLSDFTLVYAMTGGGPGTETSVLPVFMYQQAFSFYQLGYGSAISLILLLIGIIASVFYIRLSKVEL